MASKVIGADNWNSMVDELTFASDMVSFMAVYKAAGLVTDGIRDAITKLPSRNGGYGQYWIGVTDVERDGLLDGLGIAKHRRGGDTVYTHIGFDGYNAHETNAYPKGHPNSMIARSVESGTSWLHKTPFIAPTVRRLRNDAYKTMQSVLDDYIRDKTKEK